MAASGMALTSESSSMSGILIRRPIFTPHNIAKQLQITYRAKRSRFDRNDLGETK